jgi:CRP-like cAMP-binding protein
MKIHIFDKDTNFAVFPAGHVVFNAGDKGDRMYAVIEGSVDIVANGKLIETIEAGGIFGEMALIEDRPRSATATVRTESKLVAIDRNRFLFMVQQTPFFSIQVLGVVTERLRRLVERI